MTRVHDAVACTGCGMPRHPAGRCHCCDLFAKSEHHLFVWRLKAKGHSRPELEEEARVEFARWCMGHGRWPLPAHTVVKVDWNARRVTLEGRTVPA